MKLLLESRVDSNVQGREYGTVLQAAAANSHEGVVKLLLESGVDPNV